MKNENGVTLVTVVMMIIIISILAVTSVLTSRSIIGEAKAEAKKQNKLAVESVVTQYAAQASTSGVLSPVNIVFPGTKNPILEHIYIDETGIEVKENENIGEDWYLLSETDLKEIGVDYVEEKYLVNYKKNIVIAISETDNIFELVNYYENNF